jgi:hypothetical protein
VQQLTLDESLAKQRQFAAHLRNPEKNPAPDGIAEDRLQVYRELFFSSLTSFLDDTFEVLSRLLGDQWRPLNRQFFEEFQAQSPYFHRISNEFLSFLEISDVLHPAQLELARYEQRLFDAEVLAHEEYKQLILAQEAVIPAELLLDTALVLRSSLSLEGFEYNMPALLTARSWDVQCEEKAAIPQFFAFYRDVNERIQTVILSPMTTLLLEQFKVPKTPRTVLQFLAESSGMTFEKIAGFGLEFMSESLGKTLLLSETEDHTSYIS